MDNETADQIRDCLVSIALQLERIARALEARDAKPRKKRARQGAKKR